MKKLLREPLLHFLLIGGLIFAYGHMRGERAETPTRIVVEAPDRERLSDTFTRTWRRAPTQAEMDALVEAYVEEEIYVREAERLGLDAGDPVIRQRLAQKMELLGDSIELPEPSDAELEAFLAANIDDYRGQPVLSFRQTPLEGGASALPASMRERSLRQIAAVFGPDFAEALDALSPGPESHTVPSTFGLHNVVLEAREEPKPPTLARLRTRLQRDWTSRQRREARKRAFEVLRARYEVVSEP